MSRLRTALLLLLGATGLLSAGACRPITGRRAAPIIVDTLYYISARAREEGRDVTRLADSLEYGLVFTRRPIIDDPATDGARIQVLDTLLLGRQEFIATLRQRLANKSDRERFAVMYTHGFGTSLENLWEHAALARLRGQGAQPWIVFAWPSNGAGVAWPRAGEILTAAYRQDSAAAAASHGAFADALLTAQEAIGGLHLMLVAHSLGGQLIGETLRAHQPLRGRLSEDPLRAVAFVSPDVPRERFRDSIAPTLPPIANRVLLYAATDDRMLMLSGVVNGNDRVGLIPDDAQEMPVFPGVESVDMTEGQYANSWLVHAFGTRHALRRKSAALFDLVHIVGPLRPPHCRLVLGTGRLDESGFWRLTPVPVPAPSAAHRCDGP